MYRPWVLEMIMLWGCAYKINQVMYDAWGKCFEETHKARNIVPEILRRDMNSYFEYRNSWYNSDHANNFNKKVNIWDGEG